MESTVMVKKTRLNKKQISISFGFVYTKYKVQKATFKSAILDLQQKIIKKTARSHKLFGYIYIQLSRFQNLEEISLPEPISLDNINNQPHHKLQIDNKQFQKHENIT